MTNERIAQQPLSYVRQIASNKEFHNKFKKLTVKSFFVIENVPANPEELLHRLFDHCIQEALKDAINQGIDPDRLGALIDSPLLDPPIAIGVREVKKDTVDNILNRFMIVAQSKSKEGSLWGEPFSVIITTVNRAALPLEDEIRGSGCSGKRRLRNTHHQVNEKSLLKIENNNNSYCLFYALELTRILNTKEMNTRNFYHYYKNRQSQQLDDVLYLMQNANIPVGQRDYDAAVFVPKIVDYWNRIYAGQGKQFKVFIFGQLGHYKPEFVYGPDNFTHPIGLYHHDGHFDGIRHNVGTAIFGRDHYCFKCLVPYDRPKDHRKQCKAYCANCGRISNIGRPCPEDIDPEFYQYCNGCGKTFKDNRECYNHHLTSHHCNNSKKCNDCGVIWDVAKNNKNGRNGHICGTKYCYTCHRWHDKNGTCFITPIEPGQQKPFRLIFYDFETMQDTKINGPDGQQRSVHIVNLAAAIVTCSNCISSAHWRQSLRGKQPCQICGEHRTVIFAHSPFTQTEVDHKVICDEPLDGFIDWLLFNPSFGRKYSTYVYAHNSGRFDAVFIFKAIFSRGIMPKMLRRGNKIMELSIEKSARNGMVSFRDSFNFLSCGLDRLAGAFGLPNVSGKEFFPHAYNRRCNYGRIVQLADIPKDDFFYKSMPVERKKRFEIWYEQNKNLNFDLVEALPSYCLSDVMILAEVLIAFRQEFWEISSTTHIPLATNNNIDNRENNGEEEEDIFDLIGDGNENASDLEDEAEIDACNDRPQNKGVCVLSEAITISSACMRYFRMRYLKPDHIPLITSRPIDTADNQSMIALKFIQWYGEKIGCVFRNAHSAEREKKIGRYSVDAWCEQHKHIVEFHGDVIHANPAVYTDPNMEMPHGKTAGKIWEDDKIREDFLRQHCDKLEIFWESEVREMLKNDQDMRRAFDNYHDRSPIQVRQAFFGGRTQVFKMHHKCQPGWRITYGDVVSLYPWIIMLSGSFPIGAPKVHVINEPDCNVDWRRSDQIPIKGILKVFVIPPERIDIPVLPMKFDERLVYSLCRTCTLRYPQGARMANYRCNHSDEQRGWIAVLPHVELAAGLDAGYRVTHYYRGIEFEKFDSNLFKSYIQDFMGLKIQSSSYPEGVETTEQQDEFIKECWEDYGIRVQKDKMKPNKARRETVKVQLNNLWGKFGMSSNLTKTYVTDSPAVLRQYLDNKKIEVQSIDSLDEESVMITYKSVDEFEDLHPYHNPVISLWCTSLARLYLLEQLRVIVRNPDLILLYCDTDGFYVAHSENIKPFKTGVHIGQIKDEMPEAKIIEFCAGGCKNYAIRYIDLRTGEEKTILHVRGITLSAGVCELLHFETFKQSVLQYGSTMDNDEEDDEQISGDEEVPDQEILIEYSNFLRPIIKHGCVYTVPLKKRYRPIITKGVVDQNMIVREFGYRG